MAGRRQMHLDDCGMLTIAGRDRAGVTAKRPPLVIAHSPMNLQYKNEGNSNDCYTFRIDVLQLYQKVADLAVSSIGGQGMGLHYR